MRWKFGVSSFGAIAFVVASVSTTAFSERLRDAALSDCNSEAFAQTLSRQVGDRLDARAIWFSATTLRWPGVPGEGAFRLYFSNAASVVATVGNAVEGAEGDVPLKVRSTALPAPLNERFRYVDAGATLDVPNVSRSQLAALHRAQLVLVREDGNRRVIAATTLQSPGALDDLYAEAASLTALGATAQRKQTAFQVWAPTAQRVSLCVFDSPTSAASATLPMKLQASNGAWSAKLRGQFEGKYYLYLVDVWVNGVGIVRNRVTDPYSVSLSADSKRSAIIDLNDAKYAPHGWKNAAAPQRVKHPTDMTIYELHVRDFSINDATVSAANRGNYLAFTEQQSNGMRHLQALSRAGMTDIHLLPVFDLATVPEQGCVSPTIQGGASSQAQQAAVIATKDRDCYNWGYDPLHFNAPEGSFASDAMIASQRIIELRRMVQSLNAIGLRVGMDVVYNHMSSSGQNEKSVLDRVVPGYYHRLNADGKVEMSTCCDNTATEHMMMEKLMSDSVLLWAKHYKMDSFRFDLMGHQPRAAMERLQARLKTELGRDIQFIGEGWNFGEVENGKRFKQASQLSLNGSGIGTFTDRGRDAARGGGYGDNAEALVRNQGFLNGMHYDPNALAGATQSREDLMRTADMIRVGLAGSIRDYSMKNYRDQIVTLETIDYNGAPAGYVTQPGEVVNYVENHDNETLFDLNAYKLPLNTSSEDRARVQILGAALTAFSQGVAYFHAGIDVLRSKSMDRNSYDSGDWFNRLDWTYQDNYFATGLPRKDDNGSNWAMIEPRLNTSTIKPSAMDIAWSRDAFRDLLRIRSSTSLFQLRSAAEIKQRLTFLNTGSQQVPTVVAARLDGANYPGANFKALIYVINVDKVPQQIVVSDLKGAALTLHPVLASNEASDQRIRTEALFEPSAGVFKVPARSVSVFVGR
ncbi:MAG: DUF3372 domain-containing protein [Betaproteobacteria bacterium]|nr:MAG: DUF3372 domain-containing protein [Betaproteobacteria bacterium]